LSNPGAQRAASLHHSVFGGPPEAVFSAPGRVNLIGEHTDYNEGFVLPIAIDRRTSVAVALRSDNSVQVVSESMPGMLEMSLDDLDKSAMTGWSGYVFGVLWALADSGVECSTRQGLTIAIASDLPLGAGLSSSAALECAVALALDDLWGLCLSTTELAAVGRTAENEVVGANTGNMDQMASLSGLVDHAVFLDCRHSTIRPIPLELGELAIVVMDTGVSHQLVHSEYGARRASCERAATLCGVAALRDVTLSALYEHAQAFDEETLRRARHIVTENDRVLAAVQALEAGELEAFGSLLDESHESMRDDFEISSPELDLAVLTARRAGALGARMTGGGFGGSAIALIATEKISDLSALLVEEFAALGWAIPSPVVVKASAGAHREEHPDGVAP
jgi:galactokinase